MEMKIRRFPVIPECFQTDAQLSIFICYIRDGKMKRMGLRQGEPQEKEGGDTDQLHCLKLHKLLKQTEPMSIFELYFKLGLEHIADLKGYDHILFILTLCVVYKISEWKKVLVLVTAFTLGHSLTLALATLDLVRIDGMLIEFLIPLTIFLTALVNVLTGKHQVTALQHYLKYGAALFFGLIHGLGFSNYLRSLLGTEKSLVLPLFSFNLGIEGGQLLIVASIMLLSLLFVDLLKFPRRDWNLLLSGAGLGISVVLMIERFPF